MLASLSGALGLGRTVVVDQGVHRWIMLLFKQIFLGVYQVVLVL